MFASTVCSSICRFVFCLRANVLILVVSAYFDDTLEGLEGTIQDSKSTLRALETLQSIIYCVPLRTGSDYKCDEPEYKAIQSQAYRALEAFSTFLSTPPCAFKLMSVHDYSICRVLCALRAHGERAGLMSAELRRAIVGYHNAYWRAHDIYPWWEVLGKEWVQKLKRELDNLGQVRMRRPCPSTCSLTSVHLEHSCRCRIYIWGNYGPADHRPPRLQRAATLSVSPPHLSK